MPALTIISDESDPAFFAEGNWRMPPQFADIRLTLLAGDRKVELHNGEKPGRLHLEIICPAIGCTRRPYRTGESQLMNLFSAISSDPQLRAVAVSATAEDITITLDGLHATRDAARARYRLDV